MYCSNKILLSLWWNSVSYIAEDPCCLQGLLPIFLCQFSSNLSLHETCLHSDSRDVSRMPFLPNREIKRSDSSNFRSGDRINTLWGLRTLTIRFQVITAAVVQLLFVLLFCTVQDVTCLFGRRGLYVIEFGWHAFWNFPRDEKTPENCHFLRCGLTSRNFDIGHTSLKMVCKR